MSQSTGTSTEGLGVADQAATGERDAVMRLGEAVLVLWDRMPRDGQRNLFLAALGGLKPPDAPDVRKSLALILHGRHERTGSMKGTAQDREPPAGPHAQVALTNYDATPGSGLLPAQRNRGGDVDPGAG